MGGKRSCRGRLTHFQFDPRKLCEEQTDAASLELLGQGQDAKGGWIRGAVPGSQQVSNEV